jgi:hypothetical protein
MVRIVSRKWTAAQTEKLIELIDAGTRAASAALLPKRALVTVRAKARSLRKAFHAVAAAHRSTRVRQKETEFRSQRIATMRVVNGLLRITNNCELSSPFANRLHPLSRNR